MAINKEDVDVTLLRIRIVSSSDPTNPYYPKKGFTDIAAVRDFIDTCKEDGFVFCYQSHTLFVLPWHSIEEFEIFKTVAPKKLKGGNHARTTEENVQS